MTYQEIGKALGISHVMVIYIERKALMKVRKRLMALGYDRDCI